MTTALFSILRKVPCLNVQLTIAVNGVAMCRADLATILGLLLSAPAAVSLRDAIIFFHSTYRYFSETEDIICNVEWMEVPCMDEMQPI